MGGLIQTKGTQRLAKLFNNRFDPLSTARSWANNIDGAQTNLCAAFRNPGVNLLTLSDGFIAQYASAATWPNNGNDLLYPSATMTVQVLPAAGSLNRIGFKLPPGRTNIPGHIQANASFRNLDNRRTFPAGTTISSISAVGAGGTFTVTFSQNPNLANLALSDRISFGLEKHGQLVRRWRWYLAHDLQPENHAAIRSAISSALDDNDFTKITFQTIEETQRVIANAQRQTDNTNDEFDGTFILNIILLTQQTTAPDPLDPQQ
ncbi:MULTISPECIES: hypothetical protein [unclassified Bradyrhizobium]|uniref:hypothetical protein n=1 Tax=unclassified Bradyrhizobium TaxID=2631580 RepID=UPI001BACE7E8|nr:MULTISPECIES: hypothetical protein [unclassified Bradyrhizobium]MBR1228183.1 hypothetical protein [Bradyrhizobium sp. AUGA SZCCT0176]MBR1300644.1 hypothetical protein [Bradyrhizobium sp. AUGA SZCCT0042]